jgi:hypothetical protein
MGSYNAAMAPVPAPIQAPAPVQAPLPPPPHANVNRDITGSVPARPAQPSQAGWNWDGGTAVMVGPGENADSLARKYGVPAAAILKANNLTSPASIRPGQRIVIPRYNYSAAAPASVPASVPAASE